MIDITHIERFPLTHDLSHEARTLGKRHWGTRRPLLPALLEARPKVIRLMSAAPLRKPGENQDLMQIGVLESFDDGCRFWPNVSHEQVEASRLGRSTSCVAPERSPDFALRRESPGSGEPGRKSPPHLNPGSYAPCFFPLADRRLQSSRWTDYVSCVAARGAGNPEWHSISSRTANHRDLWVYPELAYRAR